MLWRNSLSVTGQTHGKLTSICFLQQHCNCALARCINYKFMCLSANRQWKFCNERSRIFAVIVNFFFSGVDLSDNLTAGVSALPPSSGSTISLWFPVLQFFFLIRSYLKLDSLLLFADIWPEVNVQVCQTSLQIRTWCYKISSSRTQNKSMYSATHAATLIFILPNKPRLLVVVNFQRQYPS